MIKSNQEGYVNFLGVAIAVAIGVLLTPLIVGVIEGTRMWQDVVLMVAGFVFAPALIISIVKKTKYPIGTSLPTAIALTAFVVCYITLGLYLAAISTGLATLCWFILVSRR